MLCILTYQCLSIGHLIYRDESNTVVVGCSADFSGEILIPQNVTKIYSDDSNNYAFKNCKDSITSLKFEENSEIVSIGYRSFYDTNLESANLSACKKLTLLNSSVFYYCYYLKSVILPPNISSIGD